MKKHRRKIRPRCWLLISVLVVCLVGGFLFWYKPTEPGVYAMAEAGTFTDTMDICGLFLYEETVVTAMEAGTFYPDLNSGEAVAAGEICGTFHRLNDLFAEPTVELTSPRSGIYSELIDGWEHVFSPDSSVPLDLPLLFDSYEPKPMPLSSLLRKGDACFKIIDNKKNVVFLADLGKTVLPENTVTLYFKGQAVSGHVQKQKYFGERCFAWISMVPLEGCYDSRFAEMELVLSKKEGILVENTVLTSRFGTVGVYRTKGGKLEFCPVSVLGKDEKKSLVSGISDGDMLLKGKSNCVF